MRKTGTVIGAREKLSLSAAGLVVAIVFVAFKLAYAEPCRAQSQNQNTPAPPAAFKYEFVSIKQNKSIGLPNIMEHLDGFTFANVPLQVLLFQAFGVEKDHIRGVPDWVLHERYDVTAKMNPAVSDAVNKLSPDDKKRARQQMLQTLFAECCKLKFHRETKDLQAYTLVIGKDGPKFQESRPDDSSPGPVNPITGHQIQGGLGTARTGPDGVTMFHGFPLSVLAELLSSELGLNVTDKTGLAGKYDFTWKLTGDSSELRALAEQQVIVESMPGGRGLGPPIPPDTDFKTVSAQAQDRLGLKLISGKSPGEVIVIDHVERPSGN